jgi:hypothetical protein
LLPKALSDDIFDFGSCNSLFFEFNSPVRPEKFPVPVCREFGFKRLNFIAESPAKIADSDQNRQNSLLFSLLAGNLSLRPVRLRLRPPPRSLTQTEISRLGANSPELCIRNVEFGGSGVSDHPLLLGALAALLFEQAEAWRI